MPMARPAAVVMAKDSRPPSSAAASAGTTSSGVVVGLSPAMGSMRMTATAGEDRGQRPVGGAEPVGRDADEQRALLVPGRRPRGQAEAGVAEDGAEHDGDHHHERRRGCSRFWVTVVPKISHRVVGQDRACGPARAAPADGEAQAHHLLEVEQQAERRHHLGQRRRLAQRPEHQPVDDHAQDARPRMTATASARGQRGPGQQVDPGGQPEDRAAPGRRSRGTRRRRRRRTCPWRRGRS